MAVREGSFGWCIIVGVMAISTGFAGMIDKTVVWIFATGAGGIVRGFNFAV